MKRSPTPEDLRAEIARKRLFLYQLASAVGLNPNRLGAMLNGRIPLPDKVAARILRVLSGHHGLAILMKEQKG